MDMPSWPMIFVKIALQFWPVCLALATTFGLSIAYKTRLGCYARLFESRIGAVGFGIVAFWAFTAILADMVITHDPLGQIFGMKNALPGRMTREEDRGTAFRDVFSRMVMGARGALSISPAATLIAFMVGITQGILAKNSTAA